VPAGTGDTINDGRHPLRLVRVRRRRPGQLRRWPGRRRHL